MFGPRTGEFLQGDHRAGRHALFVGFRNNRLSAERCLKDRATNCVWSRIKKWCWVIPQCKWTEWQTAVENGQWAYSCFLMKLGVIKMMRGLDLPDASKVLTQAEKCIHHLPVEMQSALFHQSILYLFFQPLSLLCSYFLAFLYPSFFASFVPCDLTLIPLCLSLIPYYHPVFCLYSFLVSFCPSFQPTSLYFCLRLSFHPSPFLSKFILISPLFWVFSFLSFLSLSNVNFSFPNFYHHFLFPFFLPSWFLVVPNANPPCCRHMCHKFIMIFLF